MRREFILILLGIICISTISSILSGYVPTDTDKVLLDTVVGAVGAGNFSYWQLGHAGPLLVELTSLTGDADLYVADTVRPSYESDRNNFSSVTCGRDLVSIPVDFPRPVGIGVFGHWSHHLSEYSIQVFLDTSVIGRIPFSALYGAEDAYSTATDNDDADKKQEAQVLGDPRPQFSKILSVLDMIFEMFVL